MSAPSAAASGLDDLTRLVAGGDVLVLTGAGISTDSEIPDYRGPSGRLRHSLPMTFQRFTASARERRRYWARSHVGWPRVAAARPNPGHRAVAAWEAAGLLTGTVTQNVDGLHGEAGSQDVVDLHGRLDRVVCLECGERRPRLEVALRLEALNPGFRERAGWGPTPDRPDGDVLLDEQAVDGFRVAGCRSCGGVLKPDVVFFGEGVPGRRFAAALGRLDRSRALLVLGSSLAVGSGYRFVTRARDLGLPVAIVTRGRTRGDPHAALKIEAGLSRTLPALARGPGCRGGPAADPPPGDRPAAAEQPPCATASPRARAGGTRGAAPGGPRSEPSQGCQYGAARSGSIGPGGPPPGPFGPGP